MRFITCAFKHGGAAEEGGEDAEKTKKMKSETAVWPFCVVVGDTHSGSLTVAPQRLRLHGDGEIMRSGSAEAWS